LFTGQASIVQMTSIQPTQTDKINFTKTFIASVTDSTYTVLLVGSYIVFFGICVGVLNAAGIFETIDFFINAAGIHLPENMITSLLWGIFEITGGCDKIYMLNISLIPKIILTSMILNWGGLSVHAQCISFLDNADLSKTPYLKAKSVQPFIAALISYTLCILVY
jgi:nucleoside recognition membrane protein YjiH